jgi:hypothetical protein
MDVKDVNGNGRPDMILGNVAIPAVKAPALSKKWMAAPGFIVLQNNYPTKQ